MLFIRVTKDEEKHRLKEILEIPTSCTRHKIDVVSRRNMEEIHIVEDITTAQAVKAVDFETDGKRAQTTRRAFGVGLKAVEGQAYWFTARNTVDPKTQHAVLIPYKMEPTQDSIRSWRLNTSIRESLKVFQPDSVTTPLENIERICDDLAYNVTRIYQRTDLHIALLLCLCSVLYFKFQDIRENGWVEVAFIGDSGQGKSQLPKRIIQFIDLGTVVDCGTASLAGFIGGIDKTEGGSFVSWGPPVLNDGGFILGEEFTSMRDEHIMDALKELRSEGVASITKIKGASAPARVRFAWTGNTKRQIATYSYGVEAVLQAFQGHCSDANIRRLDLACVLSLKDINESAFGLRSKMEPVEHVYTAELMKWLVLWAWSRTDEQVQITPEAEEAIVYVAGRIGLKYSSSIPLCNRSDNNTRIARLSCAVAALNFSTDETGEALVVKPDHVVAVADIISRVYDSKYFGFDKYTKSEIREKTISARSKDAIRDAFDGLEHTDSVIDFLLSASVISRSDFMDRGGLKQDEVGDFISVLSRNNALKKKGAYYHKTEAFIEFLHEIESDRHPKADPQRDPEGFFGDVSDESTEV